MRYRLNLARLTQLLAASRVSQNHWALKLGFSRGHWSDIVNGRHAYPSAKTRDRMIEVFGVSDLFVAETAQRNADVDFRIAISGRYELTTELGHGGMGTVFLANDLALGRLVALKVVAAEAAAGVGADQLLQEIAMVSRLQHPNILPLFDAGAGAGSPFYVMPYIRGGSLGARLRRQGRLPLGETTGLVNEIAAGLTYAHTHRVLHCDVKPENILIDEGRAYVMDFGIARKLHTEANEWTGIRKELDFSAGTPAYVSPEQAAGDSAIDGRSDVYSLGCVVYEMLTGRPAFAGNNTQEIVSLRFREPPPPLQQFAPDVPISVARAIEHAMSLDPAQRPATPAEFAREVSHAAASASALRTTIAVATTRAQRWVRARIGPAANQTTKPTTVRQWIDAVKQDIVYGFRQRKRAPLLTAVAFVTLALGIGLSTAVFALVDGVLLKPLPFANQERLVALEGVDSVGNNISYVSAPNWYDWKTGNRTLDGSAIYMDSRIALGVGDKSLRVESAWVSPEFFRVTGAALLWGRGFDSAEVAMGRGGALVSEGLWRRELGASRDPSLMIRVNGYPMPVIGVVAAGQNFPADADVWTAYAHHQVGGAERNNINWYVVGRLKRGVTVEHAAADLTAIARRIHDAEPVALYSYGVHVLPLREQLVGNTRSMLWLLSGSVAVVLLIACANLASANLAQGAHRQREMAVRSALGAGRGRLVRQVLVENVILALTGGVAGVALAWLVIRSASIMNASSLPRIADVGINTSVLLIAFAASAFAGLLTGVLPALQASRAAPNDVIGGSARGTVFGGRGLPGRVLVGAEIAMALMLVTGAGLLVQSMHAVLARPLGIDPDHVVTAQIALAGPRYQRDTVAPYAYWENLQRTLREQPGVRSASVATFVPLVLGGTGFIEVEGKNVPGADAGYRVIGEQYFETLGMSLFEGRAFSAEDSRSSERVAVVNTKMAEKYWPGESPLGKRVRALSMEPPVKGQPPAWITVVGVVNNVRHFGYEIDPGPEMFVLYRQLAAWRLTALTVVVRGTGADADLMRTVRATIAAQDPGIPADFALLSEAARRNTASRRFAMTVLEAFGALSLLLAGIGVYGVLSFSVAQRTREMAVRAALGADRVMLIRLVVGSGAAIVIAGLAVGAAGVLAGSRLIESMLFDVSPRDPTVLGAAALVISAIAALATTVPARRATKADPMVVLRND